MKNFTGPNPELALRVFACYPGPDGGAPLLDVDFPLLFDFDFFATSRNHIFRLFSWPKSRFFTFIPLGIELILTFNEFSKLLS